jgi:2-oxoglutarate ferredoxin oxidoreductase subunit gamma
VFYDEGSLEPEAGAAQRHLSVPATRAVETSLGAKVGANIAMLGAVVAVTGLVSRQALTDAVAEGSPPRFLDLNLRALDLGFQLGRDAGL